MGANQGEQPHDPMLRIREAEHDIEKFLTWFHDDWANAQPGSDICKDATELGFDSGSDAFAHHYFHAAADHLSAVLNLVGDEDYIPVYACFTLLRTAHEAVCRLIWMLGPEDTADRVQRTRLCALEERISIRRSFLNFDSFAQAEHKQWFDTVLASMDDAVSQIHDLECPQRCGKPQRHLAGLQVSGIIAEVDRLVNGHGPAIGAKPGAGSILRGMWSMQSGAAHGGLWSMEFAAIAPDGSDRERLRVSADVGMVAAQLKMVTVITFFAYRLYCLRSGNAESEDMSHVGGSTR